MYTIRIDKVRMVITREALHTLFTDAAVKVIKRVSKQGGDVFLSIGSFKPEFRPTV